MYMIMASLLFLQVPTTSRDGLKWIKELCKSPCVSHHCSTEKKKIIKF